MSNKLEAQKVEESYIPPVEADFEEGTRVHTPKGFGNKGLGTVQEVHDTWLDVLMDDGTWERAEIRLFNRYEKGWCWHKVLDLSNVTKGIEISRRSRRGRVFATVLEYVPDEIIVLGPCPDKGKRQLTNTHPVTFKQEYGWFLESSLLGWEIED